MISWLAFSDGIRFVAGLVTIVFICIGVTAMSDKRDVGSLYFKPLAERRRHELHFGDRQFDERNVWATSLKVRSLSSSAFCPRSRCCTICVSRSDRDAVSEHSGASVPGDEPESAGVVSREPCHEQSLHLPNS